LSHNKPHRLRLISMPAPITYNDAIQALNSRGNEVHGMHLGLGRIAAIAEELGHPQQCAPVVHIAGTNGKGSVAAMTESILRFAGLKTGLYTSPHLVRLEERIRVNGRNITPKAFTRAASRVLSAEEKLLSEGRINRNLTYFEFVTACAFLHFADSRVEVAVIEVGLGGTLDATNIVKPAVAVITGVAKDHQKILGNSLGAIAREKAGIIKHGTIVVSGCCRGVARKVIRSRAANCGARLMEWERDFAAGMVSETNGKCVIDLHSPLRHYSALRLPLAGRHQVRNASLAVIAVEQLAGEFLNSRDIRSGLSAAVWPGRMQEFCCPRRTFLDGAHNPEGSGILADHLGRIRHGKIQLVFGAMQDKDIRRMGRILFPLADSVHLAALRNERAAQPREMAAGFPEFETRIRQYADSAQALQAAWAECSADGLVVVTGSLYLIGELLPLIERSAYRSNFRPTK
jgi:dihydrofolate synthase / folylpolyglutamate synthase